MTRLTFVLPLVVAIQVLVCGSCFANNNLFLPGDAYFPTTLTQDDVAVLQKAASGKRTFSYSSLGGYDEAFCGYAGYGMATIPAVDDAFAKNLERVYRNIRKYQRRELIEQTTDEGKKEFVETNGMQVLFYPGDFEFPRHTLGLRYNENWVKECVKFGHKRADLRLCPLIADPDAIERSWRDADLVAALKVDLPDVPLAAVPPTAAPITVRGPVKAIVLGGHSLKELFNPKVDTDLTIYVVDAKGTSRMDHNEGEWKSGKFQEGE
jgi:hypothetical protein